MFLLDIYRNTLSALYGFYVFSGPSKRLKVNGIFSFISRKSIWIGNDVLLKRGCELLAGEANRSIIIGNNSEVHEGCVLRAFSGYIHIGDYCSINRQGIIWGAGGVTIGNRVRIGPRVNIITNSHVFIERNRPIMDQEAEFAPIIIGDDV